MAGLALVAACAACGNESSDSVGVDPDSAASSAPTELAPTELAPTELAPTGEPESALPDCAAIWQEGSTLPVSYQGCAEDGVDVPADKRDCSFGRPLVIFDDGFYALAGARVNVTQGPVADDRDYRSALASCTA